MIALRPALLSDLPLLRYWDSLPHVIESDPNDDWNWEVELMREPPWREQLIAELDGRPLGFVQIIDPDREETGYWGATGPGFRAIDIWIGEASDLGKGYGTIIMKLAISRCFGQAGVHAILIDPLASNTRAHRFYERLGFQFMENRIFGDDECHVYYLSRENWIASQPMDITFTAITPADLPRINKIYSWYIANSTATFHTAPIRDEELLDFLYIDHPRYKSYLIFQKDDLVGYCFLTAHKKRQAYDRTAEVTVYLDPHFRGRGVGRVALDHLEKTAAFVGLKNLVGVISGNNVESIRLFEKTGYVKCAHFRNVGEKFGMVLDVVAYQKEL